MTDAGSPFLDRDPIETTAALELLTHGDIEVRGRMPYSSNATYLVDVSHKTLKAQAIYKPHRGERQLWDFPSGLYQREVAAFEVATALGWELVPPTVMRRDAPLDIGSLQLFVPSHFEEHYFTLHEAGDTHNDAFRRICALDIIINNTDRKSGHCLLGHDGRIWAIDHGVAFHHQFKLRTVIWDFSTEQLLEDLHADLWRFLNDDAVHQATDGLLDALEIDALVTRATALATAGRFPADDSGGHRWPWPLV